ncbi:RNA-dependent RNA polymerase [Madurella fahalii]|uniref:RNA-dependent RNA polymerase n=1 Tax=Madurella fahalii TaxID=1157608 RepID=A0ABQ0GQ73_9PEZI
MVAYPSAAYPATPSKHDDSVEKIIQKLNVDYGLGIELPDSSLTPSRRKQLSEQDEQYARWDHICRGIRFLYYQRDGTLDHAIDAFFNEAKAASLRWVPKPRADPRTLPSPREPPKAGTAGQQWHLQTILIKVLDEFKAQKAPTLLIPQRNTGIADPHRNPSYDSDFNTIQTSPDSAGSKRSFDSDDDQVFKRLKVQQPAPSPYPPSVSAMSFASAIESLDNVPSRQRPGLVRQSPRKSASTRGRIEVEDGVSVRTSVSSRVSSVFSYHDGPNATQTTVEASSQEKRRAPVIAIREGPPSISAPRPLPVSEPTTAPSPAIAPQPHAVTGVTQDTYPRSPSISTAYSDFSDTDDVSIVEAAPQSAPGRQVGPKEQPVNRVNATLQARLHNIWPKFPRWLHEAPLAVAWEITRICLHCNVDLDDGSLSYNPAWATADIADLWRSLTNLDVFRGKSFPERPSTEVFAAALTSFECRGNTVVLSAALEFNPDRTGPIFLVDMKPLRFDEGCRLTRRFGPDRFFEILIPSPTAMNAPHIVKERGGAEQIIKWLTESPHSLVGRQWRAFYTKDAGYRKPVRELRLGPDAKAMFKDRVHFFAENGHNFRPMSSKKRLVVPPDDTIHQRTEFSVSQMLDWLLQLKKNESQSHLKLFSRIQLGLSKTFPAVTFEPEQIRHHLEDILSPIGKVMNDGIGRMSRSVAKKIRDTLGLSDIPSAIQGRMGSAKGMWLMDVTDTGDADWIETYPSQRKWDCDFASDPYHRTLEIRSISSELKSAGLNLQFLPVLEARARDPLLMRRAIGDRLVKDLEKHFESQKSAFKSPLHLRQWVAENTNNRSERVKHGHVPFLGGLPDNKGEILSLLLNSGFDLRKQKYGKEIVWELQKLRCDVLKTKMNIKVGRSAYIYMVVDFWGVLEENEVHVGFSSKFRDESDDTSYTLLADCDVLVARSPAHFVSDVQKVRAVFKSELHALKDVIVFSSKGNVPLADKLSGGDYDGDMAWVCWDPDIVNSFINADVPTEPDLSAYMDKDKTTFGELVRSTGRTGARARDEAVYDMISKSFWFAMQPNYLGICTNYKERLCYHNNSVSDNDAVILSSLVGKLVDQSKQGIIFDKARWERLQKELLGGRYLNDPAYKGDIWTGKGEPRHIIDYLKFSVAKPAIDRELEAFHRAMQADRDRSAGGDEEAAQWWDPDLAFYFEAFKSLTNESRTYRAVLEALTNSISNVEQEWKRCMSNRNPGLTYPEKVKQVYDKWCDIKPRDIGRGGSNKLNLNTAAFLEQPYLASREGTSYWALLKASTAFKIYYKTSPKFVWQMAGRQLAFIKAQMTSGEQAPLLITPLMYAASTPDGKFVKQYIARLDGEGSEYLDPEDAAFRDDDLGGEDDIRDDDVD